MRAVVLALLVACGGDMHPAVIPNLSQAPEEKRDDLIATPLIRPTAEQKPATKRGQHQETLAATAAAILGQMFSKTENTTLGWEWIDVSPQHKPRPHDDDSGSAAPAPAEPVDARGLVPWIELPAR